MQRAFAPRNDHSQWRRKLVEELAEAIDAERLGVVALYLLGSTKNENAGPDSDIDLILHVRSTQEQLRELEAFIEEWNERARRIHVENGGNPTSSVGIDAHLVTDDDIARRTSFAVRIGSHTDAAELMRAYG